MGKVSEQENTTASSAELELLEAQEKIAQLNVELEAEKKARAEAEQKTKEKEKVPETIFPEEEERVTIFPEEEERVTIKLFKDNKDYKDDLTVVVNGKAYRIQRGVEVSVPKSVAEVIEHSATQDEKTAQLIESLVADTEQHEKELRQ